MIRYLILVVLVACGQQPSINHQFASTYEPGDPGYQVEQPTADGPGLVDNSGCVKLGAPASMLVCKYQIPDGTTCYVTQGNEYGEVMSCRPPM